MYGGTHSPRVSDVPWEGLSPRVRGNPPRDDEIPRSRRSIPACTGEPRSRAVSSLLSRVYPRVYGGTEAVEGPPDPREGLSPRVRGNRARCCPWHLGKRSIPACTGEPRPQLKRCLFDWVYPRVYGGTQRHQPSINGLSGLSPRVRGNRRRGRCPSRCGRSIPACTGEPASYILSRTIVSVYPRVYGGTFGSSIIHHPLYGLSPRVRGNLCRENMLDVVNRSIPACTGEPNGCKIAAMLEWVYPRVYGGTVSLESITTFLQGLSPRVRGNPIRFHNRRSCIRSIPACTGEPICYRLTEAIERVYPRVYGGTERRLFFEFDFMGLSPRVRGNHIWKESLHDSYRSIPACTGEPCGKGH